jgi:enediyne biosynthesis protein E4
MTSTDDGRIDPLICFSTENKLYPIASRDEMLFQLNLLRKKFTNYSRYASATIEDVIDKPALDKAKKLAVQTTASALVENLGDGKFKMTALPIEAQISSVMGILPGDFNHDGFKDILLAGNFYPYRTQFGRSDSSVGLVLLGNGKGNFEPLPWDKSGFFAAGDVRNMVLLKSSHNRKLVVIARNNEKISLLECVGQE